MKLDHTTNYWDETETKKLWELIFIPWALLPLIMILSCGKQKNEKEQNQTELPISRKLSRIIWSLSI